MRARAGDWRGVSGRASSDSDPLTPLACSLFAPAGRLCCALFGGGDQFGGGDAEGIGDGLDAVEGGADLASFDFADVGAVKSGPAAEFFLADAPVGAGVFDRLAESDRERLSHVRQARG